MGRRPSTWTSALGVCFVTGAGPIDVVEPVTSPAMPVIAASTAASGRFAACIAQVPDSLIGLWCIGHMAPSPWPQVHSTPCGMAAVIHNATGARAIVPTWQHSQIAAAGPSTRRMDVTNRTLCPDGEHCQRPTIRSRHWAVGQSEPNY